MVEAAPEKFSRFFALSGVGSGGSRLNRDRLAPRYIFMNPDIMHPPAAPASITSGRRAMVMPPMA